MSAFSPLASFIPFNASVVILLYVIPSEPLIPFSVTFHVTSAPVLSMYELLATVSKSLESVSLPSIVWTYFLTSVVIGAPNELSK